MPPSAKPPYLSALGLVNALGESPQEFLPRLWAGDRTGLGPVETAQGTFTVAQVRLKGPAVLSEEWLDRTNLLLAAVCGQIAPLVQSLKQRFGAHRIGVVLGSTDNGSEQSLEALRVFRATGRFPAAYSLARQSAEHSSRFVRQFFGLQGPAINISTACTSSARALILARDLLHSEVCDAVLCGGSDIVSPTVLTGFHALEAVDRQPCLPFSRNRRGINLGEGAAMFVMTREEEGTEALILAGAGDSSDAHHMTGPEPEGRGAEQAMRQALEDASLPAEAIGYLNLHGTGTQLNDAMESRATQRVFPQGVPCSSTKSLLGHTLGAAGAMELAVCWLTLSSLNPQGWLPPHLFDQEPDPELPVLDFIRLGQTGRPDVCMSNSFAFGGSNVSLILARSPR